MTPPATAAAHSIPRSSPPRRAAVRHPRRVSGPATTAAAVALPAPSRALPGSRPRRPAPTRRPRPARRSSGRVTQRAGVALRTLDALDGISRGAVLDRLIRGRAWIGVLAFALIGIVAMQLMVLKLNTDVGRTLTREALLQRENAQIGIEDAATLSGDRIEPLASAAGMRVVAPGSLLFLRAGRVELRNAVSALGSSVQVSQGGLASVAEPASASTEPPIATSGSTSIETPSSTTTSTPSSAESSAGRSAETSAAPSGASTSASVGERPSSAGSGESTGAAGSTGASHPSSEGPAAAVQAGGGSAAPTGVATGEGGAGGGPQSGG